MCSGRPRFCVILGHRLRWPSSRRAEKGLDDVLCVRGSADGPAISVGLGGPQSCAWPPGPSWRARPARSNVRSRRARPCRPTRWPFSPVPTACPSSSKPWRLLFLEGPSATTASPHPSSYVRRSGQARPSRHRGHRAGLCCWPSPSKTRVLRTQRPCVPSGPSTWPRLTRPGAGRVALSRVPSRCPRTP